MLFHIFVFLIVWSTILPFSVLPARVFHNFVRPSVGSLVHWLVGFLIYSRFVKLSLYWEIADLSVCLAVCPQSQSGPKPFPTLTCIHSIFDQFLYSSIILRDRVHFHSVILSLVPSFVRSFIYEIIYLVQKSSIPPLIRLIRALFPLFIHASIPSLLLSSVSSFVRLFVYSFIN